MKELYWKMAELLKKGESFAVATIFDKTGSTPRTAGIIGDIQNIKILLPNHRQQFLLSKYQASCSYC